MGEDEEEGAEQKLVGDGIEILAEAGALGEPAGEQTVEAIGEAGEDEEGEGEGVAAVEDLDDEVGDDEQPHEREQIGGGAELGEEIHHRSAGQQRKPQGSKPIVEHFAGGCRMRLAVEVAGGSIYTEGTH